MTSEPNSTSDYPQLPCDTIVLRAMLRRNLVDLKNQSVAPNAFIRRDAPADPDGLSVGVFCQVAEYLKGFRETFGAATLHVGHIRDEGVDVIQDGPTHACIEGVPYPADDPERARQLANALARKARLLPTTTAPAI